MADEKQASQAPVAPKPAAGQTITTTATGQSMVVSGETAGSAMASYMKAMVEAQFLVAINRPRDMADVRRKLLDSIERPGFAGSLNKDDPANKYAAWYRRPRGGDGADEGFTVRFAEEAMLALGNLVKRTDIVFEDLYKRIVIVTILDLETNVGEPTSIVIEKTVERKFLKKGQTALRTRVNSYGDIVHIVEATEDEVFAKQNSFVSKIFRNEILRFLPGDLKAQCRQRIMEIRQGDVAKNPQKVQQEVSDAFGRLNVPPSQLKKYLGHELGTCTPAELADLRDLYKEIAAGDTTWHDVMMEKFGEADAPEAPKSAADAMKERLRAQQQATAPSGEEKPPATETKPEEPAKEATPATSEQPQCACKEPAGDPGKVCESCTLPIPAAPKNEPAKRRGQSSILK